MARHPLERQIEKKLEENIDFDTALELNRIASSQNGAVPQDGAEPSWALMSTIEPEIVDFLWKNRIPRGKLTDFSGDPGIGKSTVACAIAATISRGEALPLDEEPEAPMRSLVISAEDTAADVLRPRLDRMRADNSMIATINPKLNLAPSEIANRINELISSFMPALLIIDPIIAFAQGRNTNKQGDVREFLGPLGAMAHQYKTAIIMIRHFNKKSGETALYRGQGSIDFAAISRSSFVFAKDSDNPNRCFLSHSKSSLAKAQPTLEYFIDDDGSFRWGIETEESADEVVSQKPGPAAVKKAEAVKFLEKVLAAGPLPQNELKDKAAQKGLSWSTVDRAKKQAGIVFRKELETGTWFWRLP